MILFKDFKINIFVKVTYEMQGKMAWNIFFSSTFNNRQGLICYDNGRMTLPDIDVSISWIKAISKIDPLPPNVTYLLFYFVYISQYAINCQ